MPPGLFQEVCGLLACGEMKGRRWRCFPTLKTPCEQTLRGPSPINAAQTARDQATEHIHVNKSPSPAVTEVLFSSNK